MNISRPEVAFVVQIRFVKVIVASFCAVLFAFAASADDFGTIDGKEYKNVTVSRSRARWHCARHQFGNLEGLLHRIV